MRGVGVLLALPLPGFGKISLVYFHLNLCGFLKNLKTIIELLSNLSHVNLKYNSRCLVYSNYGQLLNLHPSYIIYSFQLGFVIKEKMLDKILFIGYYCRFIHYWCNKKLGKDICWKCNNIDVIYIIIYIDSIYT